MDNYTNDELLHIRDDFIDFLRKRNYKESTLAVIKRRINNLFNFLEENSYLLNRDGIDKYLMHIDKSDWIYSTKNEAFSIVRRFSVYFIYDKYVPYHPYNQFTEPSLSTYYKNILDKYLK